MPPAQTIEAEVVALAERLRAIAKALLDASSQHPLPAESLDELRKEIDAIAAYLLEPGILDKGDRPSQ